MNRNLILGITFALVVIGFLVWGGIFIYNKLKRWDCVKGTCTKSVGGSYATEKVCKDNCGSTATHSYNCVNGQCTRLTGDDSGTYKTADDCLTSCKPQQVQVPVYVPYAVHRPYRWGPRRRRHRRPKEPSEAP